MVEDCNTLAEPLVGVKWEKSGGDWGLDNIVRGMGNLKSLLSLQSYQNSSNIIYESLESNIMILTM